MKLQTLGRGKLHIIGQAEVSLKRGSIRTKAVVQIQNDAPPQLLVVTDLLHSLGDFLLQEPEKGKNQIQYNLLQRTTWNPQATEFILSIEEINRGKVPQVQFLEIFHQ